MLLGLFFTLSLYGNSKVEGYLFAIGGGHRSESMMRKFIELVDQADGGKIVIFPMASSLPDKAGQRMIEEFKKLGVQHVEYHNFSREQALRAQNVKILEDASGVYFSGGDQARLAAALVDTPIHHKLLEIYEKGAIIGGTSAGAAVMSEVMITGDENREVKKGQKFEKIQANNIVTKPGFGFMKTAIIDQHFVARKRHNRLISLVAEKPKLLGIGIDESTAIIVNPDETFEVIGEQNVIVYDASRAEIDISPDNTIGGLNIVMHILKAGGRFDLNTKKGLDKK
jgi:cyanophycinase